MDKKLINVRDKLALDRTYLANERTILAYLRTFIGMVSAGVALLKFVDLAWVHPIAILLLILAVPLLVIGIVRFWRVNKDLNEYFDSKE